MSTNVQAMTIAMFGAAAGGYTAELEASVEASGVAAVANSIMNLQEPLLGGLNLSDNAVWTDFVLGNLGINDTNAAYGEASAYFAARFAAGASRGDIIAEAVAYLLGTVSEEFAAVAEAFVAQVETAVEWSAGDGATVKNIVDLRDAADDGLLNESVGDAAVFNLTAALATLEAANTAVDAYVDAWGAAQDPAIPAATSEAAQVYAALVEAEAALESAGEDLGLMSESYLDLDQSEGEDFATYNNKDTAESLALSIVQSQIGTKQLALDGALAQEVTDLKSVDAAAEKTAGYTKGLIDTYLAQVDTAEAAIKAEAAAGVVTQAKEGIADIALDLAFDTATNKYTFAVTASAGSVLFTAGAADLGTAFGDYEASYNATTNAWSYYKNGSETALTAAQAAADVNLQKLLANADAKAVIDAAAAEAEASAATVAAKAAVGETLGKIEAVDAALTELDATSDPAVTFEYGVTGLTENGAADQYAVAVDNLATFADAKAAFAEAVTAVEAARADAASLAALEKAADTAFKAVDAQVDLQVLASGPYTAGDGSDVFMFNADTEGSSISGFGTAGNDLIYFGTGYTLVTLADDEVITDNVGSSSALEIFYDASAATIYVETETFGGNSAGTSDVVTIVLTGVTEGVTLTSAGYLAAA